MKQLRQRANELLLRLADWSDKHPTQAWTLQVRIALDVIALRIEPPLPLVGTPEREQGETERANREELLKRVAKHVHEHPDFDPQLAADIVQLMQDYAVVGIQ